MTPEEFSAVCEAYSEAEQAKERSEWERMRMLASIIIQPHVRNRVTPKELLPFPWDEAESKEVLTREQRMARAREALERLGK